MNLSRLALSVLITLVCLGEYAQSRLVRQQKDGTFEYQNFAGNVEFPFKYYYEPENVSEIQEIVLNSTNIRVVGSGHSTNGLQETSDTVISQVKFQDVLCCVQNTVIVGAGVTFETLNVELDTRGFALETLPSRPDVNVLGSIVTASHSSGITTSGLHTLVTSVDYIDGTGSLQTMSRKNPLFASMQLSQGGVGVIYQYGLQVVKAFDVEQFVFENVRMDNFLSPYFSPHQFTLHTGQSTTVFQAPRLTYNDPMLPVSKVKTVYHPQRGDVEARRHSVPLSPQQAQSNLERQFSLGYSVSMFTTFETRNTRMNLTRVQDSQQWDLFLTKDAETRCPQCSKDELAPFTAVANSIAHTKRTAHSVTNVDNVCAAHHIYNATKSCEHLVTPFANVNHRVMSHPCDKQINEAIRSSKFTQQPHGLAPAADTCWLQRMGQFQTIKEVYEHISPRPVLLTSCFSDVTCGFMNHSVLDEHQFGISSFDLPTVLHQKPLSALLSQENEQLTFPARVQDWANNEYGHCQSHCTTVNTLVGAHLPLGDADTSAHHENPFFSESLSMETTREVIGLERYRLVEETREFMRSAKDSVLEVFNGQKSGFMSNTNEMVASSVWVKEYVARDEHKDDTADFTSAPHMDILHVWGGQASQPLFGRRKGSNDSLIELPSTPINAGGSIGVGNAYSRGPWHQRLPHFSQRALDSLRREAVNVVAGEVQAEYVVPMLYASAVLSEIAYHPALQNLPKFIHVSEIRAYKGDSFPMSMCYDAGIPLEDDLKNRVQRNITIDEHIAEASMHTVHSKGGEGVYKQAEYARLRKKARARHLGRNKLHFHSDPDNVYTQDLNTLPYVLGASPRRGCLSVHFSWKSEHMTDIKNSILPHLEDIMFRHRGKPHLAKFHTYSNEMLRLVYQLQNYGLFSDKMNDAITTSLYRTGYNTQLFLSWLVEGIILREFVKAQYGDSGDSNGYGGVADVTLARTYDPLLQQQQVTNNKFLKPTTIVCTPSEHGECEWLQQFNVGPELGNQHNDVHFLYDHDVVNMNNEVVETQVIVGSSEENREEIVVERKNNLPPGVDRNVDIDALTSSNTDDISVTTSSTSASTTTPSSPHTSISTHTNIKSIEHIPIEPLKTLTPIPTQDFNGMEVVLESSDRFFTAEKDPEGAVFRSDDKY